jgi:hypothetical protein
MIFLMLGAYSARTAMHRSANDSLIWSQEPSRRAYGAYCTKIFIRCLPGGARESS